MITTSQLAKGEAMKKSYSFYIGGLVQNVSASSERDAYSLARQQMIARNGGLDSWLRKVLNGRDTLKTVNGRMFRRVTDLSKVTQ